MNRRMLITLLSCIWTTAVVCAPAPDPTAERDIRDFARTLVREIDVPSLGVAVVQDGKPLFASGFGEADRERHATANADTVYYIASSTKSYTGLAAAILHEQRKIDLDAPITKYIPEVKFPADIDPQRITLRKLLTHSAGFENDPIVTRTAFIGEHTQKQLVELLGSSKKTEEVFRYDNIGYVVAAMAMERATGKKWQDLLAGLVFKPLRMDHTTAVVSRAAKWPMAKPYQLGRSGSLELLTYVKTDHTMHPAGGIVTTPRDALHWLEAQLNEGRVGGKQAVPAGAIALAQRQQATMSSTFGRFKRTGYGLGWYWSELDGETLLHHFGGFEGWRAHISFLPKERIGVAIFANGPSTDALNILSTYIYDRLRSGPGVNDRYRTELAELKTKLADRAAKMKQELEKRAQRQWTLTHARPDYAGSFTNSDYGTLKIVEHSGTLRASIGQMQSVLEPFTEPETARVELIPGSGEVLHFVVDNDGHVTALKWRDALFQRSDRRAE